MAVAAGIDLVQLREKQLTPCLLFELTRQAAAVTRGSRTRLLVNDRADIALSAGADGVHLTTESIDSAMIRQAFGSDLLIGVSTHSLPEARAARDGGANFAVYGPVFATVSKQIYGPPVGAAQLGHVARDLGEFPVLALGGVTTENAAECLQAGASGIAAISLFEDSSRVAEVAAKLRR